jgi:hypothetical protein
MRLEGWEGRLYAVLDAARARPYKLGEHDCFKVACQVLEALTGVNRWPEFAGHYTTRREARRLIARHGRSFEAAFDWFFGSANVPVRYAQRGDIVALAAGDDKHLGVCLGAESTFLSDEGLVRLPTLDCLCAWKI